MNHLLNDTATVHLQGKGQDVVLHLACQDFLLPLIAMLKEFLDHVIAENIGHQLQRVGADFAKDLIFFVAVGRLEFLLNESRAMLITAKFDNMIVNVLPTFSIIPAYSSQQSFYLQLIPLVSFATSPKFFQQHTSHMLTDIMLSGRPSGNYGSSQEARNGGHVIERSKRIHA